jgi:hypothetical protein
MHPSCPLTQYGRKNALVLQHMKSSTPPHEPCGTQQMIEPPP